MINSRKVVIFPMSNRNDLSFASYLSNFSFNFYLFYIL